jgi:hypothetical protein
MRRCVLAEKFWIDRPALAGELDTFFDQKKPDLQRFGSTINQVFEAFVFAQMIAWHQKDGWNCTFVHPPRATAAPIRTPPPNPPQPEPLRLKFSTRGRPSNYSYALCEKGTVRRQVRHGLRVKTFHGDKFGVAKANVVIDVAVITDEDLKHFGTDDAVPNSKLLTFGEAKHMSAFAELIASFLGMAREMQPHRTNVNARYRKTGVKPFPFLYVSGYLNGTAMGLHTTIRKRRYAVEVYSKTSDLTNLVRLHTKAAPKVHKRIRKARRP